jgi:hypothetical protein
MTTRERDGWWWVLGALALLNLGNGVWMLADPRLWYTDLPAAVPDFGPYNEHFVRDLGGAFLAFGLGLGWAAVRPAARRPLVAIAALFTWLHAAGHVYDTARGVVDPDHWWIDLPGVYVPALVFAACVWLLARADVPAARLERSRP